MSQGERHQDGTEAASGQSASPSPVSARAPGDVVAEKYVLTRHLARGGMAEVWLAVHQALRTEVAIKFVSEQLARDASKGALALERFRFEAQISARLSARTRHVVAVHDAGTHAGVPYLVMEYVAGRTLEAEVGETGPMAPARFADVLDQVADALDAAHAQGIIHRDLKPSNLLLCDGPADKAFVKVADFGVAKAMDTNLVLDRPRETQRGELVGSPAFMSPEQLRGTTTVDARTDIWSVGVVAYEALTRHSCFEGDTLLDTFAAISLRSYHPASSVCPGLPRGIDAWFAKALALEPDRRFASAQEMARAFRELLGVPTRPSRRPLVAAALLGVVALAALLFAGVRSGLGSRPADAAAATTRAASSASSALPAATVAPVAPVTTTEAPAATPQPSPPRPSPASTAPAPRPVSPTTNLPYAPADPRPAPTKARKTKEIDPSEIQ